MSGRVLFKIGIVLLSLLIFNVITFAQEAHQADAIQGGLLYDNWFVILDVDPPKDVQPLWPSQTSNQRSGTITFRCAICHGWDYKGAEGAFKLGSSEYTGFKGIQGMVGASNEEIVAWLDGTNNPEHDFSEYINRNGIADLTAFIRTKQVDMALLINYEDRTALGDKQNGRILYTESCQKCHGGDGSALNFESAIRPEFIGDVALYDPWRFVHRVRFGSPLSFNHAHEALGWSLQDIVDVLAFSQTLPPGNPNAGDLLDADADADLDINYAEQGQMKAINIAALIIVVIIISSQFWTAYISKQ